LGLALARFILFSYRTLIAPVLPTACKYYPSCSHYAESAINEYGAWRGGLMAIRRVLRCHPFARGGYDPVEKAG